MLNLIKLINIELLSLPSFHLLVPALATSWSFLLVKYTLINLGLLCLCCLAYFIYLRTVRQNGSTVFYLISYTIFISFGALTAYTLFINFIGLEINKSIEILEIASYTTLSCTGLISKIEESASCLLCLKPTNRTNIENSSWRNLSVLKTAIKVYETPVNDWEKIKKDFKNKSGIYCWINKTNNKIYIGSASLFPKRLSYYFQPAYINRIDMLITKSLLKYGLINFALAILEETSNNKKEILDREDFYLSKFKPEYNILSKAGNTLGYKHTPETLLKLSEINKGRKHTDLVKEKIGAARLGQTHTEETKKKIRDTILNSENVWADKVLITDLLENKAILFKSKLAAAEYLGLTISAISKREKRQTTSPYKGRYLIEFPC